MKDILHKLPELKKQIDNIFYQSVYETIHQIIHEGITANCSVSTKQEPKSVNEIPLSHNTYKS